MGKMLDRIFEVIPTTTIIVSTLLPNGNAATEANSIIYNRNLIGIVNDRQAQGKSIFLVDMHSSWFSTADLHPDGTHPTDAGYLKMATVFYNGIVYASSFISPPEDVAGINDVSAPNDSGIEDTKCQKIPGNAIGPIQTQQGSGTNDGGYVHASTSKGIVIDWVPGGYTSQVFWADLTGNGKLFSPRSI